MSVTLGIDIGTSGTKTLAIDERGTILASATAEYPCDHPRPGWSEQHPELWWEATVDTIGRVLTAGTFRPEDVAGIGLSGQMHGSVFLDEAGAVIRRRCSGTTSAPPRSVARSSRRRGAARP